MPTTTDKKIILHAAPMAWLHLASAGSLAETFLFDNLQTAELKLTNPSNDSTEGEKVEIKRGDGAIIQFDKFSLTLSGVDESDITPATASNDASGKGTITLVTNEAPGPNDEVNSWTAFLNLLRQNLDKLWLITLPTGFTYTSRQKVTPEPDGYARMLGKINSDIQQSLSENPSSVSIEFVSYKNPTGTEALASADLTGLTYTGISWKGKSATFTPPTITSDEATDILAGEIVLTASATYTYS